MVEYLLISGLRIFFIKILSTQDIVARKIIHYLQKFIVHLAFQVLRKSKLKTSKQASKQATTKRSNWLAVGIKTVRTQKEEI